MLKSDLKKLGRPLTMDDVVNVIENAPVEYMSNPGVDDYAFSFLSSDKQHQIDIFASAVETSYEAFDGFSDIYVDGRPILYTDSMSVGAYHNEVYTNSICHSEAEAVDYLKNFFGNSEFDIVDKCAEKQPLTEEESKNAFRWSDPVYRRKREREDQILADEKMNNTELVRVVFKDKGVVPSGDYREVVFAKACDEFSIGKDPLVPNPFMINKKMWTRKEDGKSSLETTHSVLLRSSLYNRLMNFANCNGLKENSKWTGVVNGELRADDNGGQMINLSRAGILERPDSVFNEDRHNKFVKYSLSTVMKDKQPVSDRRLPDVSGIENNELDCKDFNDEFDK